MSGRIWMISDPHFGHEGMAKHRGFENAEQQDALIIKNWNLTVDKGDVVWILGDITMETKKHYHLLSKLKGIKNVVLGNHDRRQDVPELLKYVNSVCAMTTLKRFVLTHYPIHQSEIKFQGKNIHGHVHENTLDDPNYINVSAEVIDYTPVLLESL